MNEKDLVERLMAALEERGAPEALALTDLLRVEQHLVDSLKLIRQQVDALIRRASSEPG